MRSSEDWATLQKCKKLSSVSWSMLKLLIQRVEWGSMLVFHHLTWSMPVFPHRHAFVFRPFAAHIVPLLKVEIPTLLIINDAEKVAGKFEQFRSSTKSKITIRRDVVSGTWVRLAVIETHLCIWVFWGGMM